MAQKEYTIKTKLYKVPYTPVLLEKKINILNAVNNFLLILFLEKEENTVFHLRWQVEMGKVSYFQRGRVSTHYMVRLTKKKGWGLFFIY